VGLERAIKVLYGLAIFFAAAIAIVVIVGAFGESAVAGGVVLVLSPLWLILCMVVAKVMMEIVGKAGYGEYCTPQKAAKQ
jgi:hypothetical protein